MCRHLLVICLGAALAAMTPAMASGAPRVVVSIKPIHSLVAAVMGDVGSPTLIVKGAGSPHGYSLRPSEAGELTAADLIFWIGPQMEVFLDRPLRAMADQRHIVRLDESEGLALLDLREGGAFETHRSEPAASHADDDHGPEKDWHVWLDASNARALARTIADRLSEIDPANAGTYRANAAFLDRRIADVDRRVAAELAEVRERPFVVFHDAYRYFEVRYGLRTAASFTVNPEATPGARRLAEIRARITGSGATCIFAEPQFKPAVVDSVASDAGIRSGILDPLGAGVEAGPEAWEEIMLGLARSLKSCLVPAS